MASKRYSGSMDHVMYDKMPRMEAAPQPSIPCNGKTVLSDLQTCKSFVSYPLSGTEESSSSNPWSSATSYLQYAGKALNQHFQSSGVPKCQRSEAERPFNSLQPSDKSNSHFSVHQPYPVHNYRKSPSRAYPPIAVPLPVYRSPSSFIDPAYGTRDFHSIGGHVTSHALGSPALEWSPSTRFAYSSSFYVPGFNNSHPTLNDYLEVNGSPSSHRRGFQDLSPIHRQNTNIDVPLESSSSSQEEVLTDHLHPFARHLQVCYAEGAVPVGKHKNSAFTSLKHQHYKSSSYQHNPERRLGQINSKDYYTSSIDSCHQRSSPFSCSMDKSLSPYGVRGVTSYQGKIHKGCMDTERKISRMDGMLETSQFQVQQETQIKGKTNTNIEPEICQEQNKKDLCLGSGQVNKDRCVTPTKVDKELIFGSAQSSSSLHNRNLYGYCVTDLSSHISFPQQNNCKMLPPVFANSMVCNHLGKESSSLSINETHLNLDSMRVLDSSSAKPTVQQHKKTPKSELLKCIMPDSLASPNALNQHKISDDNEASEAQSQSSDLPQATPRDVDCPKSPPMPVINDVFSLAPYRAYLEGKAPHPFPIHQESEVRKKLSTSFLPQNSICAEKVEGSEKDVESGNYAKGASIVCPKSTQGVKKAQDSQGTSSSSYVADEVLDLSCKKPSQMKSSSQDHVSQKSHRPSAKPAAESSFPNVSERTPHKCQNPEVTSSPSSMKNKISVSHTTVDTFCTESFPSQAAERISPLTQEGFFPSKNLIYHSQDNSPFQELDTLPRLIQRSYSYPSTPSAHKTFAKNSLCSNQNLLLPLNENHTYRTNLKSTCLQSQQKAQYSAVEHRSQQYSDSLKRPITKYVPIQAKEMQPHKPQMSSTQQTTLSLPQQLQQNSPSRTIENVPGHGYYACISQPTKTFAFHSSATCSTQSTNISLFVNTIQTPTTLLPQGVIYPTPSPVFCPKNLNLPTHPNQSNERRFRNSVDSCQSETSLSGSENDGSGFHSSKAFMKYKYKMMKFSPPEVDVQGAESQSSHEITRSFPLPSDAAQSLPPSAPESSPTLGEANVSLASVGELAPCGSDKQFSELHRSVRAAITSSVARSPCNMLEDWLEKTKVEEKSKIPVKSKNGSRSSEPSLDSQGHAIWLQFEGISLRLHKLLSQLETFMFTRRCPFPHVIRAGAIFIPIYLVKEVLFPELLGTSVDRVLQKHKVELRPTTLSEEKLLRETELKDCSSRMLKLLALKQLPDMYPDLLHLFCGHTIQDQLGSRTQSGMHTPK